jgi:hypothetical protein
MKAAEMSVGHIARLPMDADVLTTAGAAVF